MSVFDDFSREMRKSEAMAGKLKQISSSDTRNEFKHLTQPVGGVFLIPRGSSVAGVGEGIRSEGSGNYMLDGFETVNPEEIEKKSFEIITELLGETNFPPYHEAIIKRVIHTTADFDFATGIYISEKAVPMAFEAIRSGSNVVTDTQMAAAGIRKASLAAYGGRVISYMGDETVAAEAKERNVTRSGICMERGAADGNNKIFVVGNAPTALIRLVELMKEGRVSPALVIGAPVGFVNVVESKEILIKSGVPCIITEGRKGGSSIAAAIVNAILIMLGEETGSPGPVK